jgi:hypothetical protein
MLIQLLELEAAVMTAMSYRTVQDALDDLTTAGR